ncbi:MAG: NBR1-Ig-like domain-containing protein, partial [Acidobacteriota bacterium]|nr:NBR1-Ig-like domain-containing protein [Acidobacteriota bacterium]
MFVSIVGRFGCTAPRHGAAAGLFLGLALTAGAVNGADNSAFVSYSGVPTTMEPGDKATVTVTMRNTGTTTWRTTNVRSTSGGSVTTTRTSYALRPVGGNVWGVASVAVTGGVAPNATRDFTFTITAPTAPGTYAFQWKMDRLTVVVERPTIPARLDWGFGATTPRKLIVVKKAAPDTAPSFGAKKIDFQDWLVGHAIAPLDLPEATGGNGKLTYALMCHLPRGLSRVGRRISGAPRTAWAKTNCVWKASDSDGNTAESDTAKLAFIVRARRAALVLDPESLEVDEGKSKTFKVKLDAKPTGTVTVALTSGDTTAASVIPEKLTFTAANYRAMQTVTVKGLDDPDAHGETTSIGLRASGGGYDGVSGTVAVKLDDNDRYEPPVVDPEELKGIEEGDSAGKTFKVKLVTQPQDDVTVTVTSADAGAASVDRGSLTFTTSNYATTQTVKVTGVRDADARKETTSISVTAREGGYNGESSTVEVEVNDSDKARIDVSPADLVVDEGDYGTFTVKLATQPEKNVTVSLESSDAGAVSVNPASLTFTMSNYAKTQTVRVTGVQDPDASNESAKVVSLEAKGDVDYENETASVKVTVTDDDRRALEVAPTSLEVDEGGSDTFTVKLATQPTRAVTVSLTSSDAAAASVSPASLTFTTSSYGSPRTVTVKGEQDDDESDEIASIRVRATGGDYEAITVGVDVAVKDDDEPVVDPPELVVAPASLEVEEGGFGEFTVKLATQPAVAVTVTVTSGDADAAAVSPPVLTFTTTDYGTARTVTVTGAPDADAENESTTVALSASG